MRRQPQRANTENQIQQHGVDYTEFLNELTQNANETKSVQNDDQKYSQFENILFGRVVAQSHEEITDKDILDLEPNSMSLDSDKDGYNTSPVKLDLSNRINRLEELQKQASMNDNCQQKSQNEQEEMLRIEMQLHSIGVKQIQSGSSPAVLNSMSFDQSQASMQAPVTKASMPVVGMPGAALYECNLPKAHKPNFIVNKQDQKIEECKRNLLMQLQSIKDMDSILVESKNKSIFLQTRSQRGSKFRGVSKNGSKWQIMIVRGDIKKYIGAVDSEETAAHFYDKYALIIQGFEAKTNFSYTRREIEQLITSNDNVCEQQTSMEPGCYGIPYAGSNFQQSQFLSTASSNQGPAAGMSMISPDQQQQIQQMQQSVMLQQQQQQMMAQMQQLSFQQQQLQPQPQQNNIGQTMLAPAMQQTMQQQQQYQPQQHMQPHLQQVPMQQQHQQSMPMPMPSPSLSGYGSMQID